MSAMSSSDKNSFIFRNSKGFRVNSLQLSNIKPIFSSSSKLKCRESRWNSSKRERPNIKECSKLRLCRPRCCSDNKIREFLKMILLESRPAENKDNQCSNKFRHQFK